MPEVLEKSIPPLFRNQECRHAASHGSILMTV